MRKTKLLACLLLVLTGTFVDVPAAWSQGAQLPRTGIESNQTLEQMGEKTREADKFLAELIEKIRGLNDYQYDSVVYTYLDGHTKPKTELAKFLFKRENRIRVEANSGRDKGSVVVRRKDGTIRGKAGPLLLGITMTLHEDSDQLLCADGTNVMRSDLLTQMVQLRNRMRNGAKGVVSTSPMTMEGMSVYVMDVNSKDQLGDRVIVSASTGLPVDIIIYHNGEVLSRTLVKNLRVNTGIQDELFEI